MFYNATAEASFDKAYEDVSKYAYARKDTDNDWTVELGTLKTPAPNIGVVAGLELDVLAGVAQGQHLGIHDVGVAGLTDIIQSGGVVQGNRVIRAEEEITAEELEIIRGIFADRTRCPRCGTGRTCP